VRAFCAKNKFDAVLSLGCERREDSYAAKGSILGKPWENWMLKHRYEYGYSSVITGRDWDRMQIPSPKFWIFVAWTFHNAFDYHNHSLSDRRS
jgi:hypothetical protein